jgi:Smg protein
MANAAAFIMEEIFLDERMMTLFSFIADQVRDKQQLFDDEGKIMQALLNNGCILQEADAALTLMQTMAQKESENLFVGLRAPVSMRIMNREERDHFTIDAFGFITKLTSLGIVSEDQREELLDRAMTAYPDRIGLDQIKSLVAFTLFSNSQDQDENTPLVGHRIRKTSWN